MLGDNRNGSTDSRRWTNKYVKKKRFLEKLFLNIFLGLRFMVRQMFLKLGCHSELCLYKSVL